MDRSAPRRGTCHACRRDGEPRRRRRAAPGGHPHPPRPAGRTVLGRAAPAPRAGPRAVPRPVAADPRRGHQRARHRVGAGDPGGTRIVARVVLDARRRPPVEDGADRRRDPRPGQRPRGRVGQLGRPLRARRASSDGCSRPRPPARPRGRHDAGAGRRRHPAAQGQCLVRGPVLLQLVVSLTGAARARVEGRRSELARARRCRSGRSSTDRTTSSATTGW